MHKRFIQMAIVFALCLTFVGVGTATPTPIHAADTDEYTVLSTTELDLKGGPLGTHAHLSPNGELFAYGDMKKLCVYAAAGVEQTCVAMGEPPAPIRIDPESVVWSPDGSKIAFTSQFLLTYRDPGLWMMDVVTGALTKLTGMGYERARILKDDIIFDVAPQWMPDSQHLLFLRYQQINKQRSGPFVSVIDVTTGEIKEIENLLSESISIYLTGISADGKWLAYNNDGRGSNIIEGGLWVYNFEKKSFKRLAGIKDTQQTPRVMSFNADATRILTTDYTDGTMAATPDGFAPEKSPVRLINVATGRQLLVDDTRYVRRAGWSPDGKHIAYIVYDPIREDINGLYVSSAPGKPGKLVLSGYFIVPTPREGQTMLWADNNTLIVSDRSRSFNITVVKLGVK